MNGGKRPLGYTIIEVLIVLAVSGLMFVIAANFISGKQAKTSFSSGVNEMASRIEGMIAEVETGHYSDRNFVCTVSGNSAPQIAYNTTKASGTGNNRDCTFLGKFIHLPEGREESSYEIFSLAGRRIKNDGDPVGNLNEAQPTAILSPMGDVDLTVHQTVPQLLTIEKLTINDNATNEYGFGFVQGLGSISGSSYTSGSQSASLVYSDKLKANENEKQAANDISANGASVVSIKLANKAVLCLSDGERYATITVGENNSQLTVRVKRVDGLASCV